MSKLVCAVVGVGPGIGTAVVERFAKEGFSVALIARKKEKLESIIKGIKESKNIADPSKLSLLPVVADCTDVNQVQIAFEEIKNKLGAVNVLVYNSGEFLKPSSILNITAEQFEKTWKTNCLGGLICSQQVLPSMVQNKQGTIIFTGATASLRGAANFAAFAVGKTGLRTLAQSMAREFGPQGVHVTHVIIDGVVLSDTSKNFFPAKPEDAFLSADAIADNYWNLYRQEKVAWTQELDLRPYVEKF